MKRLLCLLLLGCQPTLAPAPTAITQPDATLEAQILSLGEAPLVVVLDPSGWSAASNLLISLMKGLPGADVVQAFTSPAAVVHSHFDTPLAGLDPQRPILAALWEPSVVGPPGALAALLPLDRPATGFRHTFLLPATDPDALVASITQAAGKGEQEQGFTRIPHTLGELRYRLTVAGASVRAEVITDGPFPADAAPAPAQPSLAVRLLATPGGAGGVLVRPRMAARALALRGVHQVAQALAYVDVPHRDEILARGVAEALKATETMDVAQPELGEYAVRLAADETGLSFTGVIGLTTRGHEVLTAGRAGTTPLFAHGPGTLSLDLRFDVSAATERAWPAFSAPWKEVAQHFMECGSTCFVSWVFQAPFGLSRVGLAALPAEQRPAVQSVQVLLDEHLALAFGLAAPSPGFAAIWPAPAEVHAVPVGNAAGLLVGFGRDPRTLFRSEAPPPEGLLLDGPALAGAPWPMPRRGPIDDAPPRQMRPALPEEVGTFLKRSGQIRLEGALAEGALTWRLHLAPERKTPPALVALTGAPTPLPPEPTPAARCLTAASGALVRGLIAYSEVPPEQRRVLVAAATQEMQRDLDCARGEPGLVAAADGLVRQRAAFEKIVAQPPEPAPGLEGGTEPVRYFIAPPSIGTLGRGSVDPPPVRAIEPGGGDIVEPVQDTRTAIQMTMRRNVAKFRYCYQQALMKNPKLQGRVTLKLDVDAQGRVTTAKATGDLGDDVPACIEKVAKSLVFPALPEGPTSVTYPFHFQSVE